MADELLPAAKQPVAEARLNQPARAAFRFSWGRANFKAEAQITPMGLLAIGGMVGAILLAVAPIVREGGKARRPWP